MPPSSPTDNGQRTTVNRRFLLAIHDVTPAHRESLGRIYALLHELDISRYALLVVPDWHGEFPLERHPAFVEDLLARQAAGAEVFLHGYRHDEAGFSRSFLQRVRVAGRTAASAEFRIAPPEETARRLDQGLALFARLGLKPVGFIPPAWLAGSDLDQQLRQRRLSITEGFWVISHLESGRRRFAPALSWSTARAWRSRLTAGVAGARALLEQPRDLVRVAIHPPDVEAPVVERSLRDALENLLARRAVSTYGDAMQ